MIVAVVGIAPVCIACTCPENTQPAEESDVVLLGQVYEVESRPNGDREWRFRVQSVTGAEETETISVVTGPPADDCATTFTVGGRYKVYGTYDADREIRTTMCAPNQAVARSTPPYAGTTAPVRAHGSPYRDQVPATPAAATATSTASEGEQPETGPDEGEDAPAEDAERDEARAPEDRPQAADEDEHATGADAEHEAAAATSDAGRPNLVRDYAITAGVWAAVALPLWAMRRRKRRPV